MEEWSGVDFYVLPEGCISRILSLTSPRDACRSSVVSSVFRWAAESDIVWEKFLPSDYREVISRSVSPSPLLFSSKKELYFRLCNTRVFIDDGNKSFALEKGSGKKCYMLGARVLTIVLADTPRNWKWRSLPESRFSEVAELVSVSSLEIRGKMETSMLSLKTTYAAYFVFKFGERGAFGLEFHPAEVSVRFVRGCEDEAESRDVYLDPVGGQRRQRRAGIFSNMLRLPATTSRRQELRTERGDGWMEIEMGEFFNDRGEDGEVEMSLTEVKGGNWKAGLIVEGIELRPKESQ
ncbi:hypothetical protein HHK36_013020 [Tetracentron sinense]|uniref:Uncharacterized protein n=1 Tax=Tetracentron sinense TaxID=13715 RepID=A0A834ZBE8_TETSI|nr:hypothetical protein HHK36_013020 [Tetracentron sinense]